MRCTARKRSLTFRRSLYCATATASSARAVTYVLLESDLYDTVVRLTGRRLLRGELEREADLARGALAVEEVVPGLLVLHERGGVVLQVETRLRDGDRTIEHAVRKRHRVWTVKQEEEHTAR
jgi:hypothetical protein